MTRDIKLSNIKGLLIFLVVFGHLLGAYQKYFNGLYLFIYSFHMPLFILISGYFAKKASCKKAMNFIMLYLIFQLFYQSYLILIKPGHVFNVEYYDPYYQLWYLVSMTVWYLLAVFIKNSPLKNVNKSILILGFLIIGIGSKYLTPLFELWMNNNYYSKFDSDILGYQRTLSFLPFFFLGLYFSEENMHKLYQGLQGKKLLAVAVIVGIFAYISLTDNTNLLNIFKGSCGINQMEGSLLFITGSILIGYLIALIMCYMILNLVSSRKSFLTKWGDRTLPVFLFHIFFTRIIKENNYLQGLNHTVLSILLFVIAIAIVGILSSDIFVRLTYYLCHPYQFIQVILQKLRPAQ